MPKYRKLPIEVEAVQFGESTPCGIAHLWAINASGKHPIMLGRCEAGFYLLIQTPEGDMRVNEGDWLIKGVVGEIYPCKDKIFQKTYELVE